MKQYANLFSSDIHYLVINDVKDIMSTNVTLGDIILLPQQQVLREEELYTAKPLNSNQNALKIKGSFIFIGTNASYFHHLYRNILTGKYTGETILIDTIYKGLITYDFITILQYHIHTYNNI